MATYPLWLKLYLGAAGIILISGTINYLNLNKMAKFILDMPEHKKDKFIKIHSIVMKIYKLFFWMSPIHILLLPYLIYIYKPEALSQILIGLLLMYFFMIEDYIYRRLVVKKIGV